MPGNTKSSGIFCELFQMRKRASPITKPQPKPAMHAGPRESPYPSPTCASVLLQWRANGPFFRRTRISKNTRESFPSNCTLRGNNRRQSQKPMERGNQALRCVPEAVVTSMMGLGRVRMVRTKTSTMEPSNCALAQRSSSESASGAVRAFLYVRSLVMVS